MSELVTDNVTDSSDGELIGEGERSDAGYGKQVRGPAEVFDFDVDVMPALLLVRDGEPQNEGVEFGSE